MPRKTFDPAGQVPHRSQTLQPEALEARQMLAGSPVGSPTDLPSSVSRIDTGTFFRVNFGNGFFAVFGSEDRVDDFPSLFPSAVVPTQNLFPVPNVAGLTDGPTARIVTPDTGDLVGPGESIRFTGSAVSANGVPVPSANYVWRVALHDRGRSRQLIQPILGVSQGSFLLPSLGNVTNDAFVRITLSVSDTSGIVDTDSIDLVPSLGGNAPGTNPPRAVINLITDEPFRNGDLVQFGGFAFDPDEGILPVSNLTWRAAVHRDGRSRALIRPIVGVTSGTFIVPQNLAPLDRDDFIRLTLVATDSTGRRDRASVDLFSATPIDDGGGNNTVNKPEAQIIFPLEGDRVVPGQRVRFFGQGVDRQDGTLPNRSFTWRAALHDGDSTSGIIDPIRRTRNGSFVIPENLGDVSEAAFVRLSLTVRDSDGNTDRQTVDLPLDASGAGGNVGTAPEAQMILPGESTTYAAGDRINFSGNATDSEDGVLGAARFEWRVALHQGDRSRRLIRPILNTRAGAFTIPNNLPSDANQFVRIQLTVTDSDGRTTRVTRDISPRTSTLRVGSNFPDADLSFRVGGKTRAFPVGLEGVVGTRVAMSAPRFQTAGGTRYEFVRWSDEGARTHRVRFTPGGPNLTAIYRIASVNG